MDWTTDMEDTFYVCGMTAEDARHGVVWTDYRTAEEYADDNGLFVFSVQGHILFDWDTVEAV